MSLEWDDTKWYFWIVPMPTLASSGRLDISRLKQGQLDVVFPFTYPDDTDFVKCGVPVRDFTGLGPNEYRVKITVPFGITPDHEIFAKRHVCANGLTWIAIKVSKFAKERHVNIIV
jgi:hypothetical protein